MNHLSMDTATEVLSVALRVDAGAGAGRYLTVCDAGLRHTRNLMPLVDGLLASAGIAPRDLELVSCMRGPGSFTGLRIGMASAKGIAAAIDPAQPPLISISTLDVMAAAVAAPESLVIPVIDGKKGRFYGAAYLGGRRLTEDMDLPAGDLLAAALAADEHTQGPRPSIVATGPHAARFAELLTAADPPVPNVPVVVDPGARSGWAATLLELAEQRLPAMGYDSIDQGPTYVRRSDAEIARGAGTGSRQR